MENLIAAWQIHLIPLKENFQVKYANTISNALVDFVSLKITLFLNVKANPIQNSASLIKNAVLDFTVILNKVAKDKRIWDRNVIVRVSA